MLSITCARSTCFAAGISLAFGLFARLCDFLFNAVLKARDAVSEKIFVKFRRNKLAIIDGKQKSPLFRNLNYFTPYQLTRQA